MMPKFNILLTTYPEAYLHRGGGEEEISLISKTLDGLGVRNSIYGYQASNIEEYTHVIHFSMIPSGFNLPQTIRKISNAKLVLWPQFWNLSETLHTDSKFIDSFDLIIHKSTIEKNLFDSKFHHPSSINSTVISSFCDDIFFKNHDNLRGSFKEIFGINEYYLWVGLIDPTKDQLSFIKQIKNLKSNFVFIGNYRDQEYFNQCKTEGQNNCIFLGELPATSDLLIAAYLDCKKYIELCPDPAGISSVEASALKCDLVLSSNGWSEEVYKNTVTTVNLPSSKNEVLRAINSSSKSLSNNCCEPASKAIQRCLDELLKLG
jgi:glycosyltransferase involved in cell wall biosynthesis